MKKPAGFSRISAWLALGRAVAVLSILFRPAFAENATADSTGEAAETEVHVVAEGLREGSLPVTVNALGRIAAPRQTLASLTALAPGVVVEISVREGEQVTTGTILMKLDARAAQAELLKARAELSLAEEELRYAENSGLAQQLADLEVLAAQSRVKAAQARQEANRLADLLAKSLTSEKAAAEAMQTAETSEKEAAAAQQKAAVYRDSGKNLELARLRVKVEGARQAERLADLGAEAMTVSAPLAGRVSRFHVTVGQSVEKGVLLAEMDPCGCVGVSFELPPDQAQQVRPGMAFVLSGNGGARAYQGRIVSVGAGVGADTGLVRIEGLLDVSDPSPCLGEVLPGRITTGVSPQGFIVPISALTVDDEGSFLHLLDENGQARRTAVEVVARASQEAVVRAPELAAGRRAIVDGNYNLPDGATVVENGSQ